jgi:hypothetical protein
MMSLVIEPQDGPVGIFDLLPQSNSAVLRCTVMS